MTKLLLAALLLIGGYVALGGQGGVLRLGSGHTAVPGGGSGGKVFFGGSVAGTVAGGAAAAARLP